MWPLLWPSIFSSLRVVTLAQVKFYYYYGAAAVEREWLKKTRKALY